MKRLAFRFLPAALGLFLALGLSSCATVSPTPYRSQDSLTLEQAVRMVGQNLKRQVEMPRQTAGPLTEVLAKVKGNKQDQVKTVLMDPIILVESGQQLKINLKIYSILAAALGPGYRLVEINDTTLPQANYVLTGALSQTGGLVNGSQSGYRFVAAMIELPGGIVRGKGEVVIDTLPFEPLALYEDSPVFLQDKSARLAKSVFFLVMDRPIEIEYLQFLSCKGKLQKGIEAYDKGRFEESNRAFKEDLADPQGRTITAHAGSYLTSHKLGREAEAEKSFGDMLALAVEENRRLDIRLLFAVNAASFIPNPELAVLYASWLKLIAQYMEHSDHCLDIVGHSSRSGKDEYNRKLSLARARTVQMIMAVTYPGILQKTRIEGKGYHANIVGTGADDASDSLDRRVEFSVVDCR